jgi:hypothetical protein
MSITSWLGYEELREEVRELAYKTDKEARGEGVSSVVTGLICQGIRDPSLVQDEKILEASMAQLQLGDLHEKLVKNFGWFYRLAIKFFTKHSFVKNSWDMVRNVWAPILDPKIPPWER